MGLMMMDCARGLSCAPARASIDRHPFYTGTVVVPVLVARPSSATSFSASHRHCVMILTGLDTVGLDLSV